MPLNTDQQAVFMKVIDFINGPDKFMDVSGGAGTGKTYLISQIADTILKHQKKKTMHTVAITATTNKAAAVLSDAMPHRALSIGTIYSFMNLRVSENYTTGAVKIVPTPKWMVHDATLLIIDECSMINDKLFRYIEKGTSSTCKILFVGDRNQLSPVKEALSPIYTTPMGQANMNIPVRNANQPALMALCEQAKQTVLTGVFTPIVEVPGVIDFVSGEALKGVLEREFFKEDPDKRVLSYTNRRVMDYNTFIRGIRGYKKPFELGEILTNNTSSDLNGKIRLYTDQMVEVVTIDSEYDNFKIIPQDAIPCIDMLVRDIHTKTHYSVTVMASYEDRDLVLKHYANARQWDKYFQIKNGYPDLRSVAASTTHKAQGSTYDTVVVDLADIGKATNKELTARLQYVALSRPRNRLFIRGELPERYFK